MKKEYRFSYKDNKYLILDKHNNSKEVFSIEAQKLQFDTQKYYELLFKDVCENIEIIIEYAIDQEQIPDENTERSARYIFSTVKSLTEEICNKLNTECFSADKNAN